jgi:EmrB/QacA subfamily drug resistance transporter
MGILKAGDPGFKKAALLVATFASFLTPFMGSALNVALPTIGKDFNTNAVTLNWIVSSYILATAMILLPAGRMADIIGRKKVFTGGIILFIASSVLCALSPNVFFLITFRVFQGTGSALIFGTGVAIITSVFSPGERGRALGINVSAVYIGLTLGPFGGGLLTQYLGWRSIFWFTVPIGIIVLLLILSKLKTEWAEAKGESFDWKGTIFYALSLVFIMYGFSQLPDWTGFLFLASGIITLMVFILFEQNVLFPLFDLNLFKRNKTFAFSNLAALINYNATFAVGFLLSLYLQYIKDMDPREAGIILVSQPIVMAIFSPLSGRLSDKIEPRVVASLGMGLSTIGLFLLEFIKSTTSLPIIILNLTFLGLGFALFSSPNTNAIMSSVDKKYYGVASGSVGTMRMVGQMFSMGIVLLLFSIFLGKAEILPGNYPAFLSTMHTAFVIFTILCFFGIFASLARGKLR